MDKLSSQISSEADLKSHIGSYPELYEDLAVDALEERLEMFCIIDYSCECDGGYEPPPCEEFDCGEYGNSCTVNVPICTNYEECDIHS